MTTYPVRLTSITAEANVIAPTRRKSSDGMLGDARHRAAGGDHNPDANGVVHAVDISQSAPGAPYWEPRFARFDVHAYMRQIAAAYIAAPIAQRAARWPWLADGGYMVGFDGRVDTIFNPSVSFGWRQNGAAKTEHANHGHFSIAHTGRSENDSQPIFKTATPEDDVTPQDKEDIVSMLINRLGVIDPKTKEASGLFPTMLKRYLVPLQTEVTELKASVAKLSK